MYELTNEQLASVPIDGMDNEVCSRLVRLAASAKLKDWPEAWTESTKEKPVVNIRHKDRGIIIGGELGLYFDDNFVVIYYSRDHSVNRDRYLLNAGDGMMRINKISIGSSPKPVNNLSVRNLDSLEPEWCRFLALWRDVTNKVESSRPFKQLEAVKGKKNASINSK